MPTCSGSKGNAARRQTGQIARWLILLFACWINFGNFYAFDNPSALNRQLESWLNISKEIYGFKFMLFYSIYSIPNILIPFLMGGLLDIYGTNSLLIMLSILVCIGQGIFAIGGQLKIFPIMLFGRLVFGFGGESLTVAQARLITDWFSGNELCLAIGIALAISRLGLVLNNVLSPVIHDFGSLPIALWAGFFFCLFSFDLTYVAVLLNQRLSHVKILPLDESSEYGFPMEKPAVYSLKPLTIRELLVSTPKIVRTFHPAFFILCGACFALNGSITPFNNIASDFLQRKWYGDIPSKAAWTMSIPDTMAIFFIPIFGYAIDYFGYKVAYLAGGGFAMGLGHYLMSGNIESPIFPLIINGFASSSVVAIWPCIPSLVPEMYWATAYGIITACINASFSIIPFFVAILANIDHSYTSVEFFFALQSILGAFLSILFHFSRKMPAPLFGTGISASVSSNLILAKFEELPRAPTFNGPPESVFGFFDGDADDNDAFQWDSYDENICDDPKLCKANYYTQKHSHHHRSSEHLIAKSSHLSKHPHRNSVLRFRDDSQLDDKITFYIFLRKRSNSVLGI